MKDHTFWHVYSELVKFPHVSTWTHIQASVGKACAVSTIFVSTILSLIVWSTV